MSKRMVYQFPSSRRILLIAGCCLAVSALSASFPAPPFPDRNGTEEKTLSWEPQSPLDFRLILSDFTPFTPGGIATIQVRVQPKSEMGEIEISARLKQGMTFLDGSSEKTWFLSVPAGSSQEFTEEIQIPDQGLYLVAFQARATLVSGWPIRRSKGLKIWAGIEPPRPRQRGRALEFPAARAEEPLP